MSLAFLSIGFRISYFSIQKTGKLLEAKLPGDRSCVLVKESDGSVRALSGKCTHYGAPLAKGSYADGR